MSPRTTTQNEQIRENRREAILTEALDLFAQKGYENTSISELARNVGISKGNIYNYFDSKEDILKEVLYNALKKKLNFFPSELSPIDSKEKFIKVIEIIFSSIAKDSKSWRLMTILSLQPAVVPLLKEVTKEHQSDVEKLQMESANFFLNHTSGGLNEMMYFNFALSGASIAFLTQGEAQPDLLNLESLKNIFIEKIKAL